MNQRLGTAVVGAGLIGHRRALVAATHPRTRCVAVTDPVATAAREVAQASGADVVTEWRAAVTRDDVDLVVVATPNAFLMEIAVEALRAGKHVLVEKPMGRNLREAEQMVSAADLAGRVLKVGFNHRYHPGIAEARKRVSSGEIGRIINARCRYGHGGRPGYEREWRGNRALAGGGELTDQGVHVADLLHWFVGMPSAAFAYLQTAVWPLGDLEDNAFGLLTFESGAVASFHTSWTQWKNLFSFEIFGDRGALAVEGLGGSYGTQTLVRTLRRPEGGVPEQQTWTYAGEDNSWSSEWDDFIRAVADGTTPLGSAHDGVVAMAILDALYQSAETGVPTPVAMGATSTRFA
jgi:predicted dehydrogenase